MLDVALRKQQGEFSLDVRFVSDHASGVIALFGRSGCGKTTLVNLIAGLQHADQGHVRVDGLTWLDCDRGENLPTERREVGYVFQDARLFPHYSVRGNLLYGAQRARGRSQRLVFADVVEILGLQSLLERRPATLSGGERQRVALGRALLAQPRLLLLDEPLAALDAARREEVLPYLERLRDLLAVPMILVTHQFEEVLRLATQVLVLEGGRVVEQGSPEHVSRSSALRAIVGPDAVGAVIDGEVLGGRDEANLARIGVGRGVLRADCGPVVAGTRLRVQILARDVILATQEPRGLSVRNQLQGAVTGLTPDDHGDLVEVDIGGTSILARVTPEATRALALAPGRAVWVLVKAVSLRGHSYAAPAPPQDDGYHA